MWVNRGHSSGCGQRQPRFSCWWGAKVAGLIALASCSVATAQGTKAAKAKEVSFATRDNVEIAAVYYASDGGKEAIPLILVHEVGGAGADFKSLAEYLQGQGFAVLVPDLRGHGASTKVRGGRDLDHKKMPPKMWHGVYAQGGDIDVCKEFLIKENNSEKLNIDKLCVVGAGLGASLAVNWSLIDWGYPVLAGGVRQGNDIKAVAMLSPPFSEKSVALTVALKSRVVQSELAIYIAAGDSPKATTDDARKIHKQLDTARGGTEGEEIEKKLLLQVLKTNRQGTQLLMLADLKMGERIKEFFVTTVGKRANLPWKERKSPFE